MKSKYLNSFLYIIISGIIIFISIQNIKLKKVSSDNLKKAKNFNLELSEIKYLKNKEIASENINLRNIDLINVNKDTLSLLKLIEKNLLILRIFENSCSPCIEENIISADSILRDKPFIIIGSFYNFAAYKYFNQEYNLSNCYYLPSNKELISIETEHDLLMYYTLIDNSMKTKLVHIPLKGYIQHTNDYLTILKEKLESL